MKEETAEYVWRKSSFAQPIGEDGGAQQDETGCKVDDDPGDGDEVLSVVGCAFCRPSGAIIVKTLQGTVICRTIMSVSL